MIRLLGKLSLKLFKTLSVGAYKRYIQTLDEPLVAQNTVLNKIIADLSQTDYGKSLHLHANADYETYSQLIPIVTYDDLAPWIEKSKNEKKVLTKNPIQFFELTSGSQGAKKTIPYTRDLRSSFATCFKVWGYDCLQQHLQLSSLKTFMSISPQLTHQAQRSALQDDSDYISGSMQWLVRRYLVTQPHIHALKNADDFRFILALTLLAQEDLEIISIWSPTYLLILLNIIEQRFDEMLGYLSKRKFIYKGVKITLPKVSKKHFRDLSEQAASITFRSLWPQLKLISCWCAGTSAHSAKILRSRFPKILLQGKGLLATEAPMTLPLYSSNGYMPLLNQIFFEFEDGNQNIVRLHELKLHEEYEIIISQSAGLYRYRIGDTVQVTHYYKNTPCLEFVGRKNQISDLVGEKLHQRFVTNVLSEAPFRESQFLCLVPSLLNSGQGQYHLLTDNKALLGLAEQLDSALCEAFHYQNARRMLQLIQPAIIYHPNMQVIITRCSEKHGIAMGDQKSNLLMTSLVIAQQVLHTLSQDKAKNNLDHEHLAIKLQDLVVS